MKRIPVLALVLGLSLGFGGCNKSTPQETAQTDGETNPNENLASPEKTLEAIKAVDGQREYSQFCQFFTPDAQKTLAGGLLIECKKFQSDATNPANQSVIDETDKALVEAYASLFKKHGVDQDLNIEVDQPIGNEGQVVQTAAEEFAETGEQVLQKFGEKIPDPCLFVSDYIETLRKHGRNPDARIIEENARLENLTTTGDTAEAELVYLRDSREVRRRIGFQKVSGEWQISEVPDVFFK